MFTMLDNARRPTSRGDTDPSSTVDRSEAVTDSQSTTDRPTWSEYYVRWYPSIVGFFLHLGWSYCDAEDLAQETFVRLMQVPAERPVLRFSQWARTVARRLSIDAYRGRRRRPLVPLVAEVIDSAVGAERSIASAEILAHLLRRIDPRTRQFLDLWEHGFGKMNQSQVAQQMHISRSTLHNIKRGASLVLCEVEGS